MRRAAILGDGADAPGWTARFLLMGWDVAVALHDPERLAQTLARARRALPGLYDRTLPPEGRLVSCDGVAEAVAGAEWILITGVADGTLELVTSAAPATALVASDLSRDVETRVTVRARAPVYLLPDVDFRAGDDDAARVVEILRGVGMNPSRRTPADDAVGARPPDPLAMPEGEGAARDAALVAVLRALRHVGMGAGAHLLDHERTLSQPAPDWTRPLVTARRVVPLDWTDFNGHMTESRYLLAFADATERLMEMMGCDATYIADGGSFFTAETHIRHLGEILAGASFRIETQALLAEGAKLHVFQRMWAGDRLVATGEHFLIHVDLSTRRPAPPRPPVSDGMARLAVAHAALPVPEGAGRAVGWSR